MASKTTTMSEEQRPAPLKKQEPNAVSNLTGGVTGKWQELTHFLGDVRAEMRKVVTPSRKEVQATTSVVLVAVFCFGFFFMITDFVFNRALHEIITRLGGAQ
jgi:preprotein translocase subunit SecE